jgi:hypothetical protein
MTQALNFSVPRIGPAAPTDFAGRADDSLQALLSGHEGAARPAYAVQGTEWVSSATAGKLKIYRYDGTVDHLHMTIDLTSGLITYGDGNVDDGMLAKAGGKMTGDIDMAGHSLLNVKDGVPDFLTGLTTIRASSTTISVGPGTIKGNGRFVRNTASITKTIAVAWAAGSGAGVGGFLDIGSYSAGGTYIPHALRKISDGSFEWGWSASPGLPPNIPAGYEWVGRFWINVVDGSSAIRDYTQSGNKCNLAVQVQEATVASAFSKALVAWTSAPNGISVDMIVQIIAQSASTAPTSGSSADVQVFDGNAPASSNSFMVRAAAISAVVGAGAIAAAVGRVRTNTAKQFYFAAQFGVANGTITGYSHGWDDYQLPRVGA